MNLIKQLLRIQFRHDRNRCVKELRLIGYVHWRSFIQESRIDH